MVAKREKNSCSKTIRSGWDPSSDNNQFFFTYFQDDSHSSLLLFGTFKLQIEYKFKYAQYLSEVKCFFNRKLREGTDFFEVTVVAMVLQVLDQGKSSSLRVLCCTVKFVALGCHGLRVDTGRWEDSLELSVHLDRKDRLYL